MNTYQVGDRIRVSTSTPFTDIDSVAIDPDVVTFEIKSSDGTTASYVYNTHSNVTKIATGDYACDFDVDLSGTWHYHILGETSGSENRGGAQGKFRVQKKGT